MTAQLSLGGLLPRPVIRRGSGRRGVENLLNRVGLGPVAGVDEAGRGACCGPLVVAAVILPRRMPAVLQPVADSKTLSATRREQLYPEIYRHAVAVGCVVIEAAEVDRLGVHVANLEGMRRAVAQLSTPPGFVLTDGFAVEGFPVQSLGVIGGDNYLACVASASVIAKVTRDRIMVEMDRAHPGYGLAGHKGYATASHQAALERLGPSPEHRVSYANVARTLRAPSPS